MKKLTCAVALILALCLIFSGCTPSAYDNGSGTNIGLDSVPPFSGEPYAVINGNEPFFEKKDLTSEAFEQYSELDSLGRCGAAYANVCTEIMPTEPRDDIGMIKPSGWNTYKYDFVDGKYLYNRCHLIGFQLAGENANEKNLITGTRYMNVDGMLPFENMVADYVKETGNHVLYRVTPIYNGNDLVAGGVLMEAKSVEDEGKGIMFNVYCYNAQPGVTINYATGEASLEASPAPEKPASEEEKYILNISSHKFHLPGCSGAADIKESNRQERIATRKELIAEGYEPCGKCKP